MAKKRSYVGLTVVAVVIAGAAFAGYKAWWGRSVKLPVVSTTVVAKGDVVQTGLDGHTKLYAKAK